MRNFIEWLWRVIKKGGWLSAAIPYLLDFIAAYIPAAYVPSPIAKYAESGITLQWSLVLLFVGIFISVYLVHRDTETHFNRSRLAWEEEKALLQDRITELKADKANFALRILEQSFDPSLYGQKPPSSDAPKIDEHGFTDTGLPGWASLWAEIEGQNIGGEAGRLVYELDKTQTTIPEMFDIVDWNEPNKLDNMDIEKGDFFKIPLVQYVKIAPSYQDPHKFAKTLNSLSRYNFVIRYRTKSVTGLFDPQFLPIPGEFQEFRKKIIEYWKSHDKFRVLVEIVES